MARLVLSDGTEAEAIEVEVDVLLEGPTYLTREVPYLLPVDWRHGFEHFKPATVRLFAVARKPKAGDE